MNDSSGDPPTLPRPGQGATGSLRLPDHQPDAADPERPRGDDSPAMVRMEAARHQASNNTRKTLRSLILEAVRDSPSTTPAQIASRLNRTTSVVSRALNELLVDGTVEFRQGTDDRRKRHYSLTEKADTRAVSTTASSSKERQHIALAIGAAVDARRNRHDLGYARRRLERLVAHADELGATDLTLQARHELATTLRQADSPLPDGSSEWQAQIAAIAGMLTDRGAGTPSLFLPAVGCLEYQLGRDVTQSVDQRIRHLTAAELAFQRCDRTPQAEQWAPREGYALLARADLWRRRTEFGKSHKLADQAAVVFERHDDAYGLAQTALVLGFCHRLRGDFADAIRVLQNAWDQEGAAVSDRSRADILQQQGDAYRCMGDLAAARGHLGHAVELADRLGRTKTLGFALSSLAAVEYADLELDRAKAYGEQAISSLAHHRAGTAINERRLAVILRELAGAGDRPLAKRSRNLFDKALLGYQELNSPAGIAACLLGLGRFEDNATRVATELTAIARSEGGRTLLPKDPWLPVLMNDWADHQDVEARTMVDLFVGGSSRYLVAPEMAAEPRIYSEDDAA